MMAAQMWAFGTKRHQQRELARITSKLRRRQKQASVIGCGRMDSHPYCIALIAEEEEIEAIAAVVRPNGRLLVVSERERAALAKRRELVSAVFGGGEVRLDHGPGDFFLCEDGEVREG